MDPDTPEPRNGTLSMSSQGVNGINFSAHDITFNIDNDIIVNNTKMNEEFQEMKKSIVEMKNSITEMKEMLQQIFYAPGMPGYYEAQENFENNLQNK